MILGPTAAGKSIVAMELARRRDDVELVSADSMQVYRGMDIGTAKPTAAEQVEITHHLIDVAEPSEDYSVARFQAEARTALADIKNRGRTPVIVGGTGLYLRAVVDDLELPGRFPEVRAELEATTETRTLYDRLVELDPIAASRTESTNRRRIVRALEVSIGAGRPFSSYGPGLESYSAVPFVMVGIDQSRAVLDHRIQVRYDEQVASGFLAEAEAIAAAPGGLSRTARQALGYKELFDHLEGRCSLDEAVALAVRRTRRFARRQQRWFRRDPRIIWRRVEQNPLEVMDGLLGDFASCV